MPWTLQDQTRAETESAQNVHDVNKKFFEWLNAVRSGKPVFGTDHAALKESIRLWNLNLERLKSSSDAISSNESVMDELGQLVAQLSEDKIVLQKLQEEATTASNQSSSVNPKIRQSPYTNILGLNRVFRPSTHFAILIASIVFGVLALVVLGYLVFKVSSSGKAVYDSPIRGGAVGRTK